MSMSNPSAARLATAARSWTWTSVQSCAAVVVLAATVMVVAAGFGLPRLDIRSRLIDYRRIENR
jgi:hypothetical protein